MELDNSASGVYRGMKELKAWPMTRGEYNNYRTWVLPANEDAGEPGYLVEYLDGGKANDDRHSGYISWSPADVFERTYFQQDNAVGANARRDNDWREREDRCFALDMATRGCYSDSFDELVLKRAAAFAAFVASPKTEEE